MASPQSGTIVDSGTVGTAVHQDGLVAKIQTQSGTLDLRSPIAGRIESIARGKGQTVAAGIPIATIQPETEQIWEALRGLYLVGIMEDLPVVTAYERDLPEIPDRIRQQAKLTEEAIRSRTK
jgi:pyruvate/2-oxoglutarate dehydrogenase complex dihydrolipoamide acyltransferase (E2) component